MVKIEDSRIEEKDGKFITTFNCNDVVVYKTKSGALKALEKEVCPSCARKDLENYSAKLDGIYKNVDGKWCSTCPDCGIEQAYTRRNHAVESSKENRKCKKCKAKGCNRPVGNVQRYYNKFSKSASARSIDWEISKEYLESIFTGKCNLTGWDISMDYLKQTASLDRVDSTKGYVEGNVQWVHNMVNMSKNKYDQSMFIEMCKAVSSHTK